MSDDLSPELLAELYTTEPGDFLAVRSRLVSDAKSAGDVDLARALAAQRKPTIGAWVVNRQVHEDPSVVERLLDLGARLRAAHEQLDATVLRDLSAERRRLVTEVTTAALDGAGRADAGAALRDEVGDSVDAAVADPQIAARLGRLTRGEKWSGFGVATDAPAGAPELTVLRGGRGPSRKAAAKRTSPEPTGAGGPAETKPRVEQATARRARRARDRAATVLAEADAALQRGEDAERVAAEQVHELNAQLERLQSTLNTAKRDHDRARQDVRSARSRRREARSALDRAERKVD